LARSKPTRTASDRTAVGDPGHDQQPGRDLIDLFQTRVSTELNRFVRKVTAWGSIGIAWTVIVGLYGTNFAYMPELGLRWGYPAVLALMFIVGVLLVFLFRRRGWL
jgi:magnesium transporter